MTVDTERVEEVFAASQDATVGIEEEFALLDPGTLDLVPRFEEMVRAAEIDPASTSSLSPASRRRSNSGTSSRVSGSRMANSSSMPTVRSVDAAKVSRATAGSIT